MQVLKIYASSIELPINYPLDLLTPLSEFTCSPGQGCKGPFTCDIYGDIFWGSDSAGFFGMV